MAEAVRRFREAGGSDVVRRLIARPIRLDPPRMPARTAFADPISERIDDEAAGIVADAADECAALEGAALEDADGVDGLEGEDVDVLGRLQAEMAVMKAILMAERAEAASLRAQIERRFTPDPIGAEARATRERWAGMVDRLLLSAR